MPRPPPVNPFAAYGRAQGSVLPLRQADALAFTQAANLLEDCLRSADRTQREAALKRNQRLWTQVQRLLSRSDHPLPADVRANLLDLSHFIDRQTVKALISGAADDLRPLVKINREVAAGLVD
ncbi:flagellar biosynthesis regulator FlaF [Magnetospirillum gryphiswaldense]|uniref:Flagellar protein FlaF n=2 Tax=Magnetospirillum gryphiswaldense TaxID=55518 RepID=V6F986_MAGGM|nr:flagellar biosynthesis regulator FlaF [Magnetospirillum gryphiswaldense]AVM76418.1 flagellar biosynthesis regulatory protein FlaF [Magnetospirillum gryphiswaldense MSR-1]AVM80321.1 flagellar biosynthesis regulatory protein FlaF [Magnetospirillum gryphiswaldense]CAM74500.1 Flagellar FlaF [Magnetospirillum gryphiswaldense MSR-1]CDL01461.1 Putative flagellar protein FlaF [Magnetospirillum gryphiswaldense MSR-1 v2]